MATKIKKVKPDSKGRVSLGILSKNISSFSIEVSENGKIVLTPFVEIPKEDLIQYTKKPVDNDTDYLLSNTENKKRLLKSIKQVEKGDFQARELIED